ncbi:MAG TPA: S41 family peptidase [Bacteroidales bacterium]|nr:S41 family peptidase [Bacteroidales bacterium]HRZ21355.1 S41 family peptidase [Bacteroidales bacterium]
MESKSGNERTGGMKISLPLLILLVLIIGIYAGTLLVRYFDRTDERIAIPVFRNDKVMEVLRFIEQDYVDSTSADKLREDAIKGMLDELDPHSQYMSAEMLRDANETLLGNFEGIGIEFRIVDDTINVIQVIQGGPSEKIGLLSGDRIIKINDTIVASIKMDNQQVVKKLKGPRGTRVKVTVHRPGFAEDLDFVITRDIIPLYSVDISYMADDSTGYIKVSKFSLSTPEEVDDALQKLKERGSTRLILDLRGNVGGYLESAIKMADEFLGNEKLIVYTEGNNRPRQYAYATQSGKFEDQALAILIDEGSASASEILAGAIQDNDRGVIIGRRSFGKGLVQQQLELDDGSAVRLTVARYFTPTGRCIQRPYNNGEEAYYDDLLQRLKTGELNNQDSIRFPDSLKYYTPGGKVVYGGGGIMPDIYVPIDTGQYYSYYNQLINKGLIYQFAYDFADKNRDKLLTSYSDASVFIEKFTVDNTLFDQLVVYGESKGVPRNDRDLKPTRDLIARLLKAYVGRNLFNDEAFYPVLNQDDRIFLKALETLKKTPILIN